MWKILSLILMKYCVTNYSFSCTGNVGVSNKWLFICLCMSVSLYNLHKCRLLRIIRIHSWDHQLHWSEYLKQKSPWLESVTWTLGLRWPWLFGNNPQKKKKSVYNIRSHTGQQQTLRASHSLYSSIVWCHSCATW